MIKTFKLLLLSIALTTSSLGYSQNPIDNFATCMSDSLTGKQRKEMAKWIYFAMSVHPALKDYSVATEEDRDQLDQYIGKLVTSLLTESCPNEVIAAHKADPLAIQKGFEFLGQVAMQELMNNQDTLAAISAYGTYLDEEKISKLFTKE